MGEEAGEREEGEGGRGREGGVRERRGRKKFNKYANKIGSSICGVIMASNFLCYNNHCPAAISEKAINIPMVTNSLKAAVCDQKGIPHVVRSTFGTKQRYSHYTYHDHHTVALVCTSHVAPCVPRTPTYPPTHIYGCTLYGLLSGQVFT